MLTVLSLLLGILVVLAITAVTGYFVAQEFSYMAVDRSSLQSAAARGDETAKRTLTVTNRTSFMLSGAQLGITVTALLVGYVAEPLIGESVGEILGGVGVPSAAGVAIGTVLALVLSTVVQMVFGELFPKNLAIARPEPVARWLSRSTVLYLALFGWLIWIFDQSSNLLLKALKIEPVHDVEHSATVRDLEHIVADSRVSGDLSRELSMMLDRILDFPRRKVEHAMIPRSRVASVDPDGTISAVRTLMTSGHSRYPVLKDERVVGVIHLEDVLAANGTTSTTRELMRPATVVPTQMALPDALYALTSSRDQMACVVDEYGGFAGVLTTEDLAEELVGEIADEHDAETPVMPPGADGRWEVPGAAHVDEVERMLDIDLPPGDYETIAGLVIATCGSLPDTGDLISIELPPDPADLIYAHDPRPRHLTVEVVDIVDHVPGTLRLELTEPGALPAENEDAR